MHFTDAQIAVHKHVEERYSLVCQRRLMMKIASKIAEAQRIIAIVTGENLGQVASQTLENLRVIEEQTELIVLRPLLSYDKIETIELAKQIGTFETSILPYEDCCTVFVPSNPVTKARLFDINRVEAGLDLECLAKDIIEKSKMYRIKNGDILEVKSIEIPEEAS
jgi:thiamine biosynthesis protein ThiI